MNKRHKKTLNTAKVYSLLTAVIGDDMHAKRVLSLASGAVGVIHSASLAVSAIGRALAQAEGLEAKHAIKQVDRLLSNQGVELDDFFAGWVPYIVAKRDAVVVALDWTEFDKDDHSTLAIYLVTRHGRATPLMWRTVKKSKLKGKRNDHEDDLLVRLNDVMPKDVNVTVLADRGFGDAALYMFLESELNFDHVIRFRGNIIVTDARGNAKPAKDWLFPSGRARVLRNVTVTHRDIPIDTFVCVWAKGMADPWFLACSSGTHGKTASQLVKLYGRRFTIEEGFRDAKDIRFGMGLSSTRIKSPERRDRVLLLSAIAVVLLTLLGAAGESLGFDRMLKANTVKKRTHSLFYQGCYYYGALPNMKEAKLRPLMEAFGDLLREQSVFNQLFGVI